jgi:hypothetical protein
MNKQEAAALLKEVLTECNLGANSFVLMEPNPLDALSSGYKLRVVTFLDKDCKQKLKEISKKYDLNVIEEHNQIIVYKPKLNH